jgi:hypothetical protein
MQDMIFTNKIPNDDGAIEIAIKIVFKLPTEK